MCGWALKSLADNKRINQRSQSMAVVVTALKSIKHEVVSCASRSLTIYNFYLAQGQGAGVTSMSAHAGVHQIMNYVILTVLLS